MRKLLLFVFALCLLTFYGCPDPPDTTGGPQTPVRNPKKDRGGVMRPDSTMFLPQTDTIVPIRPPKKDRAERDGTN